VNGKNWVDDLTRSTVERVINATYDAQLLLLEVKESV
jgi:hypothetical protein